MAEGLVGEQTPSEGAPELETPTSKVYTQEEVTKLLQSETDKRVTSALQKVESRWEEKVNDLLSQKEQDIQNAKLAEEGKFKELFEQKQAELDSIKASADRDKVRAETNRILAEKNLGDLSFLFDGDTTTVEGRSKTIDMLNDKIEGLVSERVLDKLNNKAPAKGAKDDPRPKSLDDREKLAIKNKDVEELRRINVEKIELLGGHR